MTKLYEEIWRGSIAGAIEHFAEPRGEFTLVIEGGASANATAATTETADAVIAELRGQAVTSKEAVAELMRRCGRKSVELRQMLDCDGPRNRAIDRYDQMSVRRTVETQPRLPRDDDTLAGSEVG